MKFKVKSQLDHMEKGGILDDCGPSSTAAALSWAANYAIEFSAADGIKAKEKATGKKDVQGVADNGSSLADLAKTAKVLGGSARYPKSWADVVEAAKAGAGLIVWVQQPVGYPAGVEISAWHARHVKRNPAEAKSGYGHMTAAGWCADHGWWWTCPTRSGKGAEEFGVQVTEQQLLAIADSKRVSKKHVAPEFKHVLIVTHPARTAAPVAPQTAPAEAPKSPISATESPVSAKVAPVPAPAEKKAPMDPALAKAVAGLEHVDWGAKAGQAVDAIEHAVESTKGQNGMNRVIAIVKSIKDNTGLDEALLESARVFLSTCIAMMLATGAPLLDMQAGDFKVVVSGGLAAALNVVVRFLNPNDTQFGVKKP